MKSVKKFLIGAYNMVKRLVIRNITAIVSILFFLVFIYFINILQRDPNLAMALVAFGTLILALVTALHIVNSNEQEKRRRQDELAKESRDRKERWLNEIIEWAIDVSNCSAEIGVPLPTGVDKRTVGRRSLGGLLLKYQAVNTKSEFIKKGASVFGENLELHTAAKEATGKLDDVISILVANLKGRTDETFEGMPEEYGTSEKLLNDCLKQLMAEAAKIKTRDIG